MYRNYLDYSSHPAIISNAPKPKLLYSGIPGLILSTGDNIGFFLYDSSHREIMFSFSSCLSRYLITPSFFSSSLAVHIELDGIC